MKTDVRHLGFTLVELLTVMVIISILMAILLPAIAIAKRMAANTTAKTNAMHMVTAIKSYQVEYGRYPTLLTGPSDATYTSAADCGRIMDILRGIDTAGNPKRIAFLELNNAKNPSQPKDGIDTVSGALMDPWGQPYSIAIDSDYDNKLTVNPMPGGIAPLYNPVIVWSLGYKGDIAQSGVLSWQ